MELSPVVERRCLDVVALRSRGLTYREIGERHAVSKQVALQNVRAGCRILRIRHPDCVDQREIPGCGLVPWPPFMDERSG